MEYFYFGKGCELCRYLLYVSAPPCALIIQMKGNEWAALCNYFFILWKNKDEKSNLMTNDAADDLSGNNPLLIKCSYVHLQC